MAERAPNSPSVTLLEELSPGSQVVGLAGEAFEEEAGRYRGLVAGAHAEVVVEGTAVVVKPDASAPQLPAEVPEAAATEAGATSAGAGGVGRDDLQPTITENAAILKFESHEFEG